MWPIQTQDKLFHDGNGTTELGTIVTAEWLNDVQQALLGVLSAASIAPAKGKQTLLRDAIVKLINDSDPFRLRGHLASKNLNDVKGDGNYGVWQMNTNAGAAATLNYPMQQAGTLLVLPSAYQGVQLYVPYMSSVLYIRGTQQDSNFTSWRQIGEVIDNLTSSSATAALSAAQGKAIKERLDAAGVGDKAPVANASTGVNDLLADMPDTCQDYTLSGNYTNGPLGVEAKTYTGIINVSTRMFVGGVSKVLTMRMSDGSVWQNVRNASVWLGWQRIDAIASATAAALAQGLAEKADKATTLAGYGIADGVTNAAMSAAISNLVNGAPGALDTLRELATALGNDANFAATIAAQIRQAAPPGMVVYYGGKIAPAGWLKVNGAAILVSSYQALTDARWVGAAENATATWWYRCDNPSNPNGSRNVNGLYLVLEDLRGEFIRGWDDGRGVDVGRAIGSHQLDALQQHTHTIATRAQNNGGNAVARGEGGSWGAPSTEQVNTDARTDAETRPRNVALLAIIKI
jgi:hypothetical protein